MLRKFALTATRSVAPSFQKVASPLITRDFFWNSKKDESTEIEVRIPTEKEKEFGRRGEEIDAAEEGINAFDNSSIVPPSDAGTLENPIIVRYYTSSKSPSVPPSLLSLDTYIAVCKHVKVPSGMDQRAVGYEDPFTHQMKWFNLNVGEIAFIPEINLYFKMRQIR
jgi:hypothetical protein